MTRRFIAALAILALAMTIVPGVPNADSKALDCCNGIMCPMHPTESRAANCDMDKNGSAALKPCPVQAAAHYTGAIVFVLPAPMILQNDAPSESAVASLPTFSTDAELRVESPPPRLPLTA